MVDCIFCDSALDRGTKPEHILLNALGGRKTTTQIICSKCNEQFGGGIDSALAADANVIRNILQMKSGTGNPVPKLKDVKAGSDVVNLRGDGMLELKRKPICFPEFPGGRMGVQISADSFEQIVGFIPNIAGKLRITEAEARNLLLEAEVRAIERTPDPIHFQLTFGEQEAIRSAAKACLVLWAQKVGNDEIRAPAYQAARDFVRVGNEDFYDTRTAIDTRALSIGEEIAKTYGPFFNLIYVRSNATGRVVGHFTFYNLLSFQIVLAEAGGIPAQATALVSNPLDPSVRSDEATAFFDIDFDWLDHPEADQEGFTARCQRHISEAYRPIGRSSRIKELHRIIDDVFDNCGLGEDDSVPENILRRIFLDIAVRFAAYTRNLPFEEAITEGQLLAVFGGKD